jgi:2-polyprenyl-3-methyl-5-hydroxy-6-metoxy-1,4-benzoquinol methylase
VNSRAFLEELAAGISRDYPMLARGLLPNQLATEDPLWEWASLAAEHVLRITGNDDRRITDSTEAFVVASLDYIRLQARFLKTGCYAHSHAIESAALYSDPERMTEYLDGLALTYALWPNHTRMLRFYVEHFLPLVPHGSRLLEIGPGHGLLATVLLARRPDVRYVGIDISPRSISYSAAAFAAAGIAADRYDLVVGDAGKPAGPLAALTDFDAAVCCEVLEHVDEPAALLHTVAAQVESRGPIFVSTVANMEAEDHVYLFHDLHDIRGFLSGNGFSVELDQPLELAGSESVEPKPLNYSAIIRSRG